MDDKILVRMSCDTPIQPPFQHDGGLISRPLRMPDFKAYAVEVKSPGGGRAENTRPLGAFLRDIMGLNPDNFRVFGPDETRSNRLDALFEVGGQYRRSM